MGDLSLNYRVDGNGSPLLLIHGFGISFNIWGSLVPLLRPHFTLIMVELPGIGHSPVQGQPYLEETVDGLEKIRNLLEIERWDIFSYSSGTRVAEKYIQSHPARVDRAIFLCPAQVSAAKALSLNFLIQLDQHMPRLGDWVLSGERLKFLIDLLGFNLKKTTLSSDWFTEISSQPVAILKETLRSLPGGGKRPFYIPEHISTLFIWAHEDLIVDVPRKQLLHDRMIHATHGAPLTAPQLVSEVVLPFLRPIDGNPNKIEPNEQLQRNLSAGVPL